MQDLGSALKLTNHLLFRRTQLANVREAILQLQAAEAKKKAAVRAAMQGHVPLAEQRPSRDELEMQRAALEEEAKQKLQGSNDGQFSGLAPKNARPFF